MSETSPAGFRLEHENRKLTAWGPDLAGAFQAALEGILHAAGAPAGIEPGGKSETIQASGANPAELLDALVTALHDEGAANRALDGSITMGGVVRSDTGWNGWASVGVDPDSPTPVSPFELPQPPSVERKPGKVRIKCALIVWDDQMLHAMEQLRALMPPDLHPGGVVGPDPNPSVTE
jgi:hypothetical protein